MLRLVVLLSLVLVALALAPAKAARSVDCPRGLQPLTGTNPIGAASQTALRSMKKADRPQVTGALFASADRARGTQAKAQCGPTAWRRTIVVYVTARAALPAQSASQRVFFVGRFQSGYRVWQVVR